MIKNLNFTEVTGVYVDNERNRKLGRVGKTYTKKLFAKKGEGLISTPFRLGGGSNMQFEGQGLISTPFRSGAGRRKKKGKKEMKQIKVVQPPLTMDDLSISRTLFGSKKKR